MNKAKIPHIIAAICTVTAFLVGAVFVPTALAEDKEYTPPKLVWEKTLDQNIEAVGIDEECFCRAKGDIAGCLKWIYSGGLLRRFDRSGEVIQKKVRGGVHEPSISTNGKYFIAVHCVGEPWRRRWWKPGEGFYYELFDWNGRFIWGIIEGTLTIPLVRNDGSVVFPMVVGSCEIGLVGVKFLDASGRVKSTYRLPEPIRHPYLGLSENFFVVPRHFLDEDREVCVFEKFGEVIWRREIANAVGGVAVSDSGEVLLVDHRMLIESSKAFVYDREGDLRDSISLYPTGLVRILKIDGRFGFVSNSVYGSVPRLDGGFLCYDFQSMEVKFLLKAEDDCFFGNFDVNQEAGLIAVTVRRRSGGDALRIYDFEGECKAEIQIEAPHFFHKVWLRLLDGALLVAEGNKLRLYEIDVE